MQIGKQLGRGKRARNYTCDTSESKDCRLNVIEKTCFMLGANPNLSDLQRNSPTGRKAKPRLPVRCLYKIVEFINVEVML